MKIRRNQFSKPLFPAPQRKKEKEKNTRIVLYKCLGFEVNYGEGNNDGAQVFYTLNKLVK